MSAAIGELRGLDPASARESDTRFAARLALAMLGINLVGFGPTLYLRPLFDAPPIPLYLYVHGILGTGWFALLVAQTMLIRKRNFVLHRRLGWVAVTLAAFVLIFGIQTSTNLIPRNLALGEISTEQLELFSLVTAADTASFIYFPTLVGLAIWHRTRMDVHMRLLLTASFGITGPAVARIASWFGEIPNPVNTIATVSIVGALLVQDFRTRGRPHWATVFGVLLIIGLTLSLIVTGIGAALVESRLRSG